MEPLSKTELLEKWKDPNKFFTYCTGSYPYRYQSDFFNDNSDYVAWVAARQVGKSTSIGIKALHHVMLKPNQLCGIISASERQSKEIVYKIRNIQMNQPTLKQFVDAETVAEIRITNGSRILSLPPGAIGKTIQGFPLSLLIFDEAALISDPVFDAMMPSILRTHGKILMVGRPWGQRGKFYEAWNLPHYSKHHTISYDCPDISEKTLELMKISMSENEWMQNCMGVFVSGVGGLLSRDLILSCIIDGIELDIPVPGRIYYLGVDIARLGLDETVYTIVEQQADGSFRVVKIISTSKMRVTDLIGRIKDLHEKWHFARIFVDETGIGGATDLVREANMPLSQITFTLPSKTEMYQNLIRLMENMKLKFPNNDKLINQLAELQMEYTSNQMMKIHHPQGGHDDFPDSLALACFASTKPVPYMGIRGAKAW